MPCRRPLPLPLLSKDNYTTSGYGKTFNIMPRASSSCSTCGLRPLYRCSTCGLRPFYICVTGHSDDFCFKPTAIYIALKLAVTIIPGKWSERYGCDLEGFPIQSLGIDCGIFMLMSALYVALEAPFDYSIADMPTLRKWWCVLLMENFELDSLGRLFAHWTEKSKPVIEGNHVPVFRLPKRKQVEVCQEPAVARDLHVAILWVQSNEKLFRGHCDCTAVSSYGRAGPPESY
ncbi:uncharacterized protein [Paramormyrops kingsleyae]|uniref:uncharacterized protein n=1 Tax=Paramormyrops kingsleyae TaxID=1676925 RepID=UPI003B978C0F